MQPNFTIENLIFYLKEQKKAVFVISVFLAISYSSFRIYTKLSKYEAQIKFYITSSDAVDYKTILDKSFIDISVEQRDLLRLQSFGYSNQLLNIVADSIIHSDESFLDQIKNEGNLLKYVSKYYQVNLSGSGEIEITTRHTNEKFCYFLCHHIMNGINAMNNDFLSEFKLDQIEASQRQLKLLGEEKKEVLRKINSLSSSINDSDLKSLQSSSKNYIDKKDLQDFISGINSPEKLELNLCLQKIQNLDENIETFNRSLYNDKWSIEMLQKKKPFITQNKPALYMLDLLNISILFVSSFLVFFFLVILFYSIKFRYQKYIKMLFS
jgi:hypothetical protein